MSSFFLAFLLWFTPALADEPREVRIGYLDRSDDTFYTDAKGYAGLYTVEHRSPLPAAELAIDGGKAVGEALGVKFTLVHRALAEGEDASAALVALIHDDHVVATVLDLRSLIPSPQQSPRQPSPYPFSMPAMKMHRFRQDACHTRLLHTTPSLDMLTDGLAQGLLARNWTRVLVLEGRRPADLAFSLAFQASTRKFGLDIADVRPFVLGNDPRERGENNVRLLTGEFLTTWSSSPMPPGNSRPSFPTIPWILAPSSAAKALSLPPGNILGAPGRPPAQSPLCQARGTPDER